MTITFWAEGPDGEPVEATLTCDPAGGTHPDPEAACGVLTANADALEPVPADAACTMIFGGPEQATVVGTVNGEQVDAAFERSNGCELDRWDPRRPGHVSVPQNVGTFENSVLPVLEAGLAKIVGEHHTICPGVDVEPSCLDRFATVQAEPVRIRGESREDDLDQLEAAVL